MTVLEDRQLLALTTLASVNGQNLVLDSQGNLYGTSTGGDRSSGVGFVFEIAKGSNTMTTLASFNGTGGDYRHYPGNLVLDGQGNLYGTSGSTVFEIAKGSNAVTTVASFNGTNGNNPNSLALDGQGNLYGTTYFGGVSNQGTVFEIAKGSNIITTLASFDGTDVAYPSSPVLDGQGNLYGTTPWDGATNSGTVFEIAKGSNTVTTLASFNGTNGVTPDSLVLDSQGNLYGASSGGGSSGDGTVFEIAKGSNTITTLVSFNGTNGNNPNSLVLDGQGNLYGTSGSTVSEIAKGSNTITTLVSFNGANGNYPNSLVLDSQGNLYVATEYGGAYDVGTVFELSGVAVPFSQTISFGPLAAQTYGVGPITLSATATSGLPVSFSVVSGPATVSGNVVTVTGAGTVVVQASQPGNGTYPAATPVDESFAVAPAPLTITANNQTMVYGRTVPALSYTYTGLVDGDTSATFTGGLTTTATSSSSVGAYPITQGTLAATGNYTIGTFNSGILTVASPLTTVASFNGTNGDGAGGLVLDSQGNMYGMTWMGGADSDGTVFEIARGSNTITTLASFNGINGANPGCPILDGQGNLYGMTQGGGAYGDGTVFEIAKGSNTITTLTSFNGTNGAETGSLILDSQGNLYGTTFIGGAYGDGTVFEIAQGSNTITTIASFNNTNGNVPKSLVLDSQGNLYGATFGGGAYSYGTVFEVAQGSNTITTIASFNGTNGQSPHGLLVLDSQGNLYGMSGWGGAYGYGTVFEIAQGSNTITTLASFNGTNGYYAQGFLVLDGQGNLYGATGYGGAAGDGTVSEVAQGSNTITTLVSFNGTNGADPNCVALDSQGNLYGTTAAGGAYNKGTVFKLSGVAVPFSQTISFGPLAGQTYGVGPITLSATATSGLPVSFSVVSGPATVSGNVVTVTGAGTVVVQASQPGNGTYPAATPVDESFTVAPAPLTITADNKTMVYGGTVPALSYTYTGLVNGDTSVPFTGGLATTATSSSSVGAYPITLGTLVATGNYAIGTFNPGTLVVNPAPLTITANNASTTYGAALPSLSASYSGFVNGDTPAFLASLPTLVTTASAASHVGSYTITAGGASSNDYTIAYVPGTLTVTPAPLTITANNATKMYGAAVPTLTASYNGWVNGDSVANLLTEPIVSITASAVSHVGSYTITASGASSPDYTISYMSGTLSVNPAPLTITANNAIKMYGVAMPVLTAGYSGFVNGDGPASLATPPMLSTTASASSPVFSGGYAIIASGASDPDYSISYQPGTLLITPAPLTITANNASMFQGAAVPPLSVYYSGFVNGDSPASLSRQPTVTTAASPFSPAGIYPIEVGGVSSSNYAINYANGVLVVTPAPVRVLRVSIQAMRLGKTKKTTQVIVLQFSGALNPGGAQRTSNYSLTTIPANKRQKSQSVALSQAQYNTATNAVTLITRKPLVLNPPLKLTLSAGSLLDSYNRPLSGKGMATLSRGGIAL